MMKKLLFIITALILTGCVQKADEEQWGSKIDGVQADSDKCEWVPYVQLDLIDRTSNLDSMIENAIAYDTTWYFYARSWTPDGWIDEERKVTTFNPEQTARNFREIMRRMAN